MATLTPLEIASTDGYPLAAQLYSPADPARGVAVLAPAMGVPQSFYSHFAHWLAEQGWQVISFDYRGMGESRRGSLRALDIDLIGWAQRDCAAVIHAASALAAGKPLVWFGHSLGGQLPGLIPNIHQVRHIFTIAAGSGYWRENAWPLKRRAWLLWYGFAPLLTPLFGYFPGRRLGMVGDLPRGVMQQWRRWCLHRDYAVGVEGEPVRRQFASVRVPICAFGFDDDELMSARNTASLHGFYSGSPLRLHQLAPAELGVSRIGHFGFFRPTQRDALWQTLIAPELTAITV